MAVSPRKLATNSKYLQKLDQLVIRLRRDGKQDITKLDIDMAASEAGLSTNAYVVAAIKARMEGGMVQAEQEPKPQDTLQGARAAQGGLGIVEGVYLSPKAKEALQEALEREQKPADEWLSHAAEAQNEREKRTALLNRAAAQARENERKMQERAKNKSSDQ